MGGCEKLQGKLGGARVTAAMNGGAGEKTGRRRTVDMARRLYLPAPSLEGT